MYLGKWRETDVAIKVLIANGADAWGKRLTLPLLPTVAQLLPTTWNSAACLVGFVQATSVFLRPSACTFIQPCCRRQPQRQRFGAA